MLCCFLKSLTLITFQVGNALDHLKSIGIIHSDIKMENIVLVNQEREPYRVKVIDFGVAFEKTDATIGSYIQTRPYR